VDRNAAPPTEELRAFLLTRDARQERDGLELVYWATSERGPIRIRLTRQRAVLFVERDVPTEAGERSETSLVTLEGAPVDRVAFVRRDDRTREAERLAREGTPAWEADVKPADRALMERFITAGVLVRGRARAMRGFLDFEDPELAPAEIAPALRVVSIDVEAEGPGSPLYCVGLVSSGGERVFVRGEGPPRDGVSYHADERSALAAWLAYVEELDPDVLIGWNVIDFDIAYLEERCARNGLRFTLGRGGERASVLRGSTENAPSVARVPGRVVLDGIATLRAATWSFDSFSLEHVARTLLGRGKAIHDPEGDRLAEIQRLYAEEISSLIEYNLEDCRLVRDIFARAKLLEFAIERQRLTGLTMDRRAGAVSAFDHLYLPRLHRAGRVAPTTGRLEPLTSPGGYVMDSVPGLYDGVVVLDFKSLYPSIIRTFLVDPLGLATAGDDAVEGFGGARFSRDTHILPGLIESLWAARDEAKRNRDAALSRAIKILMNSFYGVLGTPACRFYDPRLATSITRRGHEVLQRSRAFLEARGLSVLYGDTDSLFVRLGADRDGLAVGRDLVEGLNAYWRERVHDEHGLDSALEVQLETCYRRFFMPTIRGSDEGSKKRYAGLVIDADGQAHVVVKGLEAARTDWTPLARSFQRELLRRVFLDEPYDAWIRALTDELFAGKLDDQLVYRKRLRRELESYVKNVPPHIAAARQLERTGREIAYVMTVRGPQPLEKRSAAIDYQHYLERQLAPAADGVLACLGDRFMRLGSRQLSLF
jgi:DNA polymerase-2